MDTKQHYQEAKLSIKNWAEEDRPREKLLAKGKIQLSDAELLAILIGSGNKNKSALEISQLILNACNQNLMELSKMGIPKLKKFNGIGQVKAIVIEAALELGRRRQVSENAKKEKLTNSQDAYQLLRCHLEELAHEEFWIIYLDRKNTILNYHVLSKGGSTGTVVDIPIIFRCALENKASQIVLAHNHPSGMAKPSNEDIKLTRQLLDAGKIVEIRVLDHLIVVQNAYYSFADEGLIHT